MVTDRQVRRLRKLMNSDRTKEIAVTKAEMDGETADTHGRAVLPLTSGLFNLVFHI